VKNLTTTLLERPLAGLLVIFLILRTLILFSSVSNLIFHQELCIGTLTEMLTKNTHLPVFSCLDKYRWGGAIIGIVAVPFFRLFGDSLLILRLVMMLVSLGTLVVLYLFLNEFFSKRTAVLASLLFIFSPPNYTRMSYIASGSYSELNFLTLLTVFVFYKIFFARKDRTPGYLYAFFGFLCGFGLFYDYIFLLTLACCLLFWLIFDARFFLKKYFYIFLVFFLIGFSPWFLYNVAYHWNGVFIIHGRSIWQLFTGNSPGRFMTQLGNLLLHDIPGYFDFKGPFISYSYYFVFLASFLCLAWVHRRPLARLMLNLLPLTRFRISAGDVPADAFPIVYSVLFCLVYSLCGFPIFPASPVRENIVFPYKEVFPLTPFIFIIVARFLDIIKKSARQHGPLIFSACLSLIILIAGAANLRLIEVSGFAVSLIPQGYNYVRVGKQLNSSCIFRDNLDYCLAFIEKIDKKNRRFVYDGYEWAVYAGLPVQAYAKRVLSRIDQEYWPFAYERMGENAEGMFWSDSAITQKLEDALHKEYLPYFYRGAGRAFMKEGGAGDLEKYLFLRNRIDEKYRPYFHEGIGIELDEALIDHTAIAARFLNSLDRIDREYVFKGFGMGREYREISYVQLFRSGFGRLGADPGKWNAIMEKIEEGFRADAYQRLGIEVGWRFIHGIKKYLAFLEEVEARYRPSLYKGVGIGIGWRFGYDLNGCMRIAQAFDKRFLPSLYAGLGAGAMRRYGYQPDEWGEEIKKIPVEYKFYFAQGVNEAFGERHEAKK
jgi:4-amino-4-deoxy-L-arabinose transferase-like glycosyltransferase